MKQALNKLHSKVSVKIKPLQLAELMKVGINYQPSFNEAISFVNKFYHLVPPVWMNTFSNPQIMKSLISQCKVQYISIILKYSQVDPYILKTIVQKRFTKEFYSFQKEITVYKMAEKEKLLGLIQQNTTKIDYLFNFAVKWMSLDVDVNFLIRWIMLVHPTEKSHHDLLNMVINQIISQKSKIKWEDFYNLCTLKLYGTGNISSLFARLPISSSDISSKLFPSIANSSFPVSSFIKMMMNYSCPTKVIQITECIIRKLAYNKKFKNIQEIFNNFCKPVLIKQMPTSIYYMEFDKIMRCLMEIKQVKYSFTLEQINDIMSKLNCYKPKEHYKLMQDLVARYSPQSRLRLQNAKQSLLYESRSRRQTTETAQIRIKKKDSFQNDKQLIMECQNLIGLPNIGNSCYMNSFIMSLYSCTEFQNAIAQNEFKNKTLGFLKQIFLSFSKKQSQNLSKLMLHFKSTLPMDYSTNIEQQDAMDFGRELLSCIIQNQPKVGQLFQSKFHEVLRCPQGHIHSKSIITENHLILNFSNPQVFASMIKSHQMPNGIMLEQLLKYWFMPVVLDNNYTCSQCNKPFNKIQKQTYPSKFPKILILCISRFAYNLKSKKILDKVIAKQNLIISQQNSTKSYKLISFLNHMGNTSHSGHYQAYKTNNKQSWINFDDDYVTQVSAKNTEQLFNSFNVYDTPYILFYQLSEDKQKA